MRTCHKDTAMILLPTSTTYSGDSALKQRKKFSQNVSLKGNQEKIIRCQTFWSQKSKEKGGVMGFAGDDAFPHSPAQGVVKQGVWS